LYLVASFLPSNKDSRRVVLHL